MTKQIYLLKEHDMIDELENQQKINLRQFVGGTGNYYRHWLPNCIYTDGIKHVADEAQAHWLLDLVFSHIPRFRKTAQWPYYVTLEQWTTEAKPEGAKVLISQYDDDGKSYDVTLQTIPFTDFPFQRFENDKFTFKLGTDGQKFILCLIEED